MTHYPKSGLADPIGCCHGGPACPNGTNLPGVQRTGFEHRRVLGPPAWTSSSDDGGVDSIHRKRKPQRGSDSLVEIAFQERIVERPQALPIGVVIGIFRFGACFPGSVGDGTL